jgi:uncharacterized protein
MPTSRTPLKNAPRTGRIPAAAPAAARTEGGANPAPLGLLGFGMTTMLLNLHNTGLFPLCPAVIAMGIFVGGLAQVIAGIMEFKKGNTFGLTAFTAYGVFWLSLVAIWLFPGAGTTIGGNSPMAMGFYLLIWGLFTVGMFFATLRLTLVHQIVFASLAVLFILLAIADFTGITDIARAAGMEGILCGLAALYGAIALVLNEVMGRTVLPMGGRK